MRTFQVGETANFINSYFANIGPNLARNHHLPWEYKGLELENTFDLKRVTEDEVLDTISKTKLTKSSKSSGVPHVKTKILIDN